MFRKDKTCFDTRMPVHDIYVNRIGWLTVLVRAKNVPGCADLRINIDPVDRIVGAFDYHIDTGEQAKDSARLYLQE